MKMKYQYKKLVQFIKVKVCVYTMTRPYFRGSNFFFFLATGQFCRDIIFLSRAQRWVERALGAVVHTTACTARQSCALCTQRACRAPVRPALRAAKSCHARPCTLCRDWGHPVVTRTWKWAVAHYIFFLHFQNSPNFSNFNTAIVLIFQAV